MSRLFDSAARLQGAETGPPACYSVAAPAVPAAPAAPPVMDPLASSAEVAFQIRQLDLKVAGSSPVLPFDGTHPYASEQYRILRTKVMHHPKRPRTVVIASAGPRDGKTTNAINLAAVFALRSEARVLLIDGDIRRPAVASQLGLPATPGLVDVLEDRCALEGAAVRAAQIPNLSILPAGEATANPSELLASAAWKTLLARAAERYHFVFVDSPPMAAVADYALIQSVCEGVVIVIRQDHTKRKHCLEAIRQVPKDKLIGVIVNSVTAWPLDDRQEYDMYYGTYGQRESAAAAESGRIAR